MYYIYGISGPSLLAESTDSMIPTVLNLIQRMEKNNFNFEIKARFSGRGRQSLHII